MGDSQNWRTDVDAGDYFSQQKKQLSLADRRPVIRKTSDLVGPGIAPAATPITFFEDLLATYNGYYSYTFVDAPSSTAAKAPNTTDSFVGFVVQDGLLGGVQTFYSLDTVGRIYRRTFLRNPMDPSSIVWGDWITEGMVRSGSFTFTGLADGTTASQAIAFNQPLPLAPNVVAQFNLNVTNLHLIAVTGYSATTTGFTLRVRNETGSTIASLPVSWIARTE